MNTPKKLIYIAPLLIILHLFNLNGYAMGDSDKPEERSEKSATVTGQVVDAEEGDPVPYINVIIEETTVGTITDEQGWFAIDNAPPGSIRLIVKGMEYETAYAEFEAEPGESVEITIEVRHTGVELEEVVLTSSPTASGFRYQSDFSLMGEDLARQSEVSLGEMLEGRPGVTMRSMGSAPSRPVIRGMDGDRVLVLQDGERMGDIAETAADHSISMDPLSASRVEVVKGPASLLYGSSALGGVINMYTRDIPEDWDKGATGTVSLQGATMNNMGSGFGRYTYGGESRAITGRFSYRNTGNITTPEGELPGTHIDHLDAAMGFGIERESVSGGISLSANHQTYGLPEELDDPYEEVEVRQQRYGLQGRFSFEREGFFDKAQLRFNGTHLSQEEVEIETIDGVTDEFIELSHDKSHISSTLTLQHKPVGIFDRGAVGLNLHGHTLDIGGEEAYTPGEERVNLGLFTFQEIPLSQLFRLQAGLRMDANHVSAMPNHLFPDISKTRNVVNFTGSVGINFRPSDNIEIGGQFARSHRNPLVEELFADGPHLGAGTYELGDPGLQDEIGHGADIFISWQRENFHLELTGFVNYFENYIIFEPTGDIDPGSELPIFEYLDDEARFYGSEFSMRMKPVEGLTLDLGMDYVNARRTTGEREYLPFIPPFRINSEIEYDYGKGWVGAKVRHAATQDRVAPHEEITEGYTLLGLQAGYRINKRDNHSIILRVDNVLDTSYRDHLSRVEDRHYVMPGRDFRLVYRWVF